LDYLDLKPLQQIAPVLNRDCCSEERLFRATRLLPKEEIDKILEDQDQIVARCDFCGTVCRMSPDEVEERFPTATGDNSLDEYFYKS
jgi:redox-regulated HSP33 family molecular chaperone